MRKLLLIGSVLASIAPARADTGWVFGIGTLPCSRWTAQTDSDAISFVQGFYSGLNLSAQVNHHATVGSTMTGLMVAEEVAQYCLTHPTEPIANAAAEMWVSAISRGR
jgi:hypothetical protein